MKFRLIEDQRERFPVRVVCDVMGVSPAGYYAWRGRPESPRKMANRALLTEIRRVHTTLNPMSTKSQEGQIARTYLRDLTRPHLYDSRIEAAHRSDKSEA